MLSLRLCTTLQLIKGLGELGNVPNSNGVIPICRCSVAREGNTLSIVFFREMFIWVRSLACLGASKITASWLLQNQV